jgi:hypothetical protein
MFKIKQTEEELIAEMHNEFDTAPERLLNEALDIMNEAEGNKVSTEEEVLDKARRLYKLGFSNTEIVAKMTEIKERNKLQDEIIKQEKKRAQRIAYYNDQYPKCKYLTIDELNRICKKYGLVYAKVEHYTKTVPTENLEEIEANNPNILFGDKPRVLHYIHWRLNSFARVDEREMKKWENPLVREYDYEKKFSRWDISMLLEEQYNLEKSLSIDGDGCSIETVDKSGLFIAAPKNHFNSKDLSFDGSHGLFSLKKSKVIKTDPVVFKFVRDGVLIITKWGLVGDDPLLKT